VIASYARNGPHFHSFEERHHSRFCGRGTTKKATAAALEEEQISNTGGIPGRRGSSLTQTHAQTHMIAVLATFDYPNKLLSSKH